MLVPAQACLSRDLRQQLPLWLLVSRNVEQCVQLPVQLPDA